jgi:hypothetical protein
MNSFPVEDPLDASKKTVSLPQIKGVGFPGLTTGL